MEPDAEDETSSHPLPLVEEEVEPAAPTGGRRLDTHEWIALAIGVLALCAGIFALVTADDDPASPLDTARDSALIAAPRHIPTMNTMDYRRAADGRAAWEEAPHGLLPAQPVAIAAAKPDRA